ncbi:MAG: TerB family tellurite resistance protein [Cyclobacteriaceae bacterium]|nr:TerB family tellurite resistance protein [Cyclobacteriaceae bacterium]
MVTLQQLKLLVNLASIDGSLADKERQFIINIGQANHLLVAEILPLFSSKHETVVPDQLTADEKFELLLKLVQLMKIDGKLYKDEIKYCAQVASKLGYREEVMVELMLNAKAAPQGEDEINALRQLTQTYLVK